MYAPTTKLTQMTMKPVDISNGSIQHVHDRSFYEKYPAYVLAAHAVRVTKTAYRQAVLAVE
jgi:hypothetical protein